ncbi:MAG: hypothetical protein AVDCRST_MAG69-752, partial [uncultured Solirubrobacteraceae bacterium]
RFAPGRGARSPSRLGVVGLAKAPRDGRPRPGHRRAGRHGARTHRSRRLLPAQAARPRPRTARAVRPRPAHGARRPTAVGPRRREPGRAGDHPAGGVGRRRCAAPRQPELRRGAAGLRAPHRRRQRLRPGGLGRHRARDRPLSPRLQRLERHRLQLPGRQVRPGLRGARRRHRPAGDRRPGAGLQRRVDRHRLPGGLQRDRAVTGGHGGACAPAGVEARRPRRARRGTGHRHLRRWPHQPLQGGHAGDPRADLRPPRRQQHLLPRAGPLRAAPGSARTGRRPGATVVGADARRRRPHPATPGDRAGVGLAHLRRRPARRRCAAGPRAAAVRRRDLAAARHRDRRPGRALARRSRRPAQRAAARRLARRRRPGDDRVRRRCGHGPSPADGPGRRQADSRRPHHSRARPGRAGARQRPRDARAGAAGPARLGAHADAAARRPRRRLRPAAAAAGPRALPRQRLGARSLRAALHPRRPL